LSTERRKPSEHPRGDDIRVNPLALQIILLDEIAEKLEEGNEIRRSEISHGRTFELAPHIDSGNSGMPFQLPDRYKSVSILNSGPSKVKVTFNLENQAGFRRSLPENVSSGDVKDLSLRQDRILSHVQIDLVGGTSADVKLEFAS